MPTLNEWVVGVGCFTNPQTPSSKFNFNINNESWVIHHGCPLELAIITYIVQPWELSPWWIGFDIALKVDVITLLDVVHHEGRAESERHNWWICNQNCKFYSFQLLKSNMKQVADDDKWNSNCGRRGFWGNSWNWRRWQNYFHCICHSTNKVFVPTCTREKLVHSTFMSKLIENFLKVVKL